MFSGNRSSSPASFLKPKNFHSLEHLKYLYNVLASNAVVTEQNQTSLEETLRSISEILIWGDQNDSTVFDFFLEKNMLSFFICVMRQKSSTQLSVQLLQTLNILFENIKHETSLYYLFSNNQVNAIIEHRFNFSEEEVMAYYISFLKTLSFKLNKHTIHFFFNEAMNEFSLYTEAVKFFNHSESMVRIAVRTITLNIYKVEDESMMRFITSQAAAPYFSNLVWFIGNHVLELDTCLHGDNNHNNRDRESYVATEHVNSRNRPADLVAEHVDQLQYINDILLLNIRPLNSILNNFLLNRLLLPLYIYSLSKPGHSCDVRARGDRPFMSSAAALFVLSQVFCLITSRALVEKLTSIILHHDRLIEEDQEKYCMRSARRVSEHKFGFLKPSKVLGDQPKALQMNPKFAKFNLSVRSSSTNSVKEECLKTDRKSCDSSTIRDDSASTCGSSLGRLGSLTASNSWHNLHIAAEKTGSAEDSLGNNHLADSSNDRKGSGGRVGEILAVPNFVEAYFGEGKARPEIDTETCLDRERSFVDQIVGDLSNVGSSVEEDEFPFVNRPYFEAILTSLECQDNDRDSLFALCLLSTIANNKGINAKLLEGILIPRTLTLNKNSYNICLMDKLISIMSTSAQSSCRVSLTTLELSISLIMKMAYWNDLNFLQDQHLAVIEGAKEDVTLLLRSFYKSEEIFLYMFEDVYNDVQKHPLNVEHLLMKSSWLLAPIGVVHRNAEHSRRSHDDYEQAEKAIKAFLLIRQLSLLLQRESDQYLPLTKSEECIHIGEILNLNNCNAATSCLVYYKDGIRERRFLVIDLHQMILIEPHVQHLGSGIVRFVTLLQDIEVTSDSEDGRSLYITVDSRIRAFPRHHQRPLDGSRHQRPLDGSRHQPLLAAKFVFEDQNRCMTTRERLEKGKLRTTQRRLQLIARLLDLPAYVTDSIYDNTGEPQSTCVLRIGEPKLEYST